ncbi:MAG: class I SAM-dependent methyltransferase [Oscillospiraceae bacterium]|nr:class I SAM-dependent methyltransferase [Oscillospiraceae bacterium]
MEFWDRVAGLYDFAEAFNGKVYREICDLTRRLTPRGAVVLDCAAGTGELSLAAARKAKSVLCTDLSENMLKKARAKSVRIGNITFEPRNIFHLEDPDNTYDVVIAGNVLHLLDAPEKAVKELYRVLKPGGRLLLPTFITKGKSDSALLKLYGLLGYKASSDYSVEEYKAMLKNCGCGKVRTKTVDGFVPCCYAVIEKI